MHGELPSLQARQVGEFDDHAVHSPAFFANDLGSLCGIADAVDDRL